MKKEYLPSKEFQKRVILVTGILILIFALYKVIPIISKSFLKAKNNHQQKKVLVKDLVEKDSNSNGIPDWEESLWGLDPDKNGKENLKFILEKRKTLGYTETKQEEELTTNDKMARELLALIVSLKESDNLDEETIAAISQAVSEKTQPEELKDFYKKEDLNIVSTTTSVIKTYYNDFSIINEKYINSGIGEELTFLSQAVKNNDPKALEFIKDIANSYRNFGKDLSLINIPSSLVEIHLTIINDYEKIAQTIESTGDTLTDQLSGMKALLSYKKYMDDLTTTLNKLKIFFERNAIIKE